MPRRGKVTRRRSVALRYAALLVFFLMLGQPAQAEPVGQDPPLGFDRPGESAPKRETKKPKKEAHPQPEATQAKRASEALDQALEVLLKEEGLKVYHRAKADLDGDGVDELVSHVARSPSLDPGEVQDPESALLVMGMRDGAAEILAQVPEGMLCPYCPVGTFDGVITLPEQSLTAKDGGVEICESWGSSWFASECVSLTLGESGELAVTRHQVSSGWTPGPSEHRLEINFLTQRGRRVDLSTPHRLGYPVLERETEFSLLVAPLSKEQGVLDGALDEEIWGDSPSVQLQPLSPEVAEKGIGEGTDLSARARAYWTGGSLWVGLEVADDQLEFGRCDDEESILEGDRVELWLDLGGSLKASGNAPWIEEYRKVYFDDPLRVEPDEAVLNYVLALSKEGLCVTHVLPREGEPHADELVAELLYPEKGEGYVLEMEIPAAVLGLESLESREIKELGISLVVHDRDQSSSRDDSYAISAFRWGDPSSFALLVLPSHQRSMPTFPFAWDEWLE